MDSITEGRIQKTLMEMSKGKTCLIIAHRLSTVVHANKILVISNGEIFESGSHLQLLKQDYMSKHHQLMFLYQDMNFITQKQKPKTVAPESM